jgi:thiol-disulfide isomerase/thioredoxin
MRVPFCTLGLAVILTCGNALATLGPGSTQPDFTLSSIVPTPTQQIDLYQNLSGKILVFDFFAYWCGPCATASSELELNIQKYYAAKGGNIAHLPVEVVSFSIDGSSPASTQAYINAYGVEFALDDSAQTVYSQYSAGYIPQFAILDGVANTNHPQWQVLYTQTGYSSGGYTAFRNVIDSITMTLAGDANLDGTVNLIDLSYVLANFDKTGMTWAKGDFTGDGMVNMADLSKLLTNFDRTSGSSAAGISAVPEPSSVALLTAGLLAALLFHRASSK